MHNYIRDYMMLNENKENNIKKFNEMQWLILCLLFYKKAHEKYCKAHGGKLVRTCCKLKKQSK